MHESYSNFYYLSRLYFLTYPSRGRKSPTQRSRRASGIRAFRPPSRRGSATTGAATRSGLGLDRAAPNRTHRTMRRDRCDDAYLGTTAGTTSRRPEHGPLLSRKRREMAISISYSRSSPWRLPVSRQSASRPERGRRSTAFASSNAGDGPQ